MNDIINIQVSDVEEVVSASVVENNTSNNVSVSEITESVNITIDEADEINISATELLQAVTILVEDANGNLSINVVEQQETINIEVQDVGIKGDAGLSGPPGPSGQSYNHVQSVAATLWVINHSLGFKPNITAFDSDMPPREVEGEIEHIDINNAMITFIGGFSGEAYCS